MEDFKDFAAIATLIHHVRTDKSIKLRFGASKRHDLKLALQAGEHPDHYRIKWLTQTRDEMAKWLTEKAKEFNALHQHDSCSVADLIDVCSSTLALLRKINEFDD